MVAGPGHPGAPVVDYHNCGRWWLCPCTLHLHPVLMPDRSKAYEGVLALVFGLLLLAYFQGHPVWLPLALIITLATLISPFLARAVAWGWTKLAEGIGYVVSRILLALVFFLILTPMALLQRAFRKNPLQLTPPSGEKGTVFMDRSHVFTGKDLERPW